MGPKWHHKCPYKREAEGDEMLQAYLRGSMGSVPDNLNAVNIVLERVTCIFLVS